MILIALFLFHMLFIEIARYYLAYTEAEAAARSAGRSVLSDYQTGLLNYGLFGVSGTDENMSDIINRVAAKSSLPTGSTGFYDSAIRSSQVTAEPLYHLGDHYVFRNQVLEKMKYIGGIEFVREVARKISTGRQPVEEAQHFAQLSERMEGLLRERNAKLDLAWDSAQELIRTGLSAANQSELSETGFFDLQLMLDQLSQIIRGAEELNLQIRNELQAVSGSGAGNRTLAGESVLPRITILPDEYFQLYIAKAASVVSLVGSVALAAQGEDPEGVQQARANLHNYASGWLSALTKDEEQRQREMRRIRQLQEDEKKKLENELKRAGESWTDGCSPSGSEGYIRVMQAYQKLEGEKGYYQKYRQFNLHDMAGEWSELTVDDPQSFGMQSLSMLGRVMELAQSARDEVFVNEYALTFFTYRTWGNEGNQADLQPAIGDRRTHLLENQEAEYILYGLPDCNLNLGAAHTELFAVRMALRTVEALLQPKQAALGNPMLVLLSAMAEGAKQANADAVKLVSGESAAVPLLAGVTMNYKDHLRLFYLLHSHDASALSRMQALIELNTSLDLMKHYSAVRVNVNFQPRLRLIGKAGGIRVEIITSY